MAIHGSIDHAVGAVTLLGGGGYLLFRAACDVVDGLASRNWYTTSGVITVSDLQRSSRMFRGWTYKAEITYRYAVNGAEFTGSHAKYGDEFSSVWSTPAAGLVRKYSVGTEVQVHYDPEHPEESVLEPGVLATIWLTVPLGIIGIVFGSNAIGQLL